MPHHFRTIEAFVQLLEANKLAYRNEIETAKKEGEDDMFSRGAVSAYSQVLDILRTSNIGIVYPPPEQCLKSDPTCSATCQSSGRCHHMNQKAGCDQTTGCNRPAECDRYMRCLYARPIQPNGTCCPDCGLPCDPATGEHKCSDGQVRGFRVSPE